MSLPLVDYQFLLVFFHSAQCTLQLWEGQCCSVSGDVVREVAEATGGCRFSVLPACSPSNKGAATMHFVSSLTRDEQQMVAQLHLFVFQPLKSLNDRGNGPEKPIRIHESSQEVFSALPL